MVGYPIAQPRRLRQREPLRRLIRETRLSVDHLVLPLFVRAGRNVRVPIPSLPGHFQLSVDQVVKEAQDAAALKIPAVLLFGLAQKKDEKASGAYAKDGLLQQATAAIKSAVPNLAVITDVCLCAYTSHGHCGILRSSASKKKSPKRNAALPTASSLNIDQAATLNALAKTALSHAHAGADMVAPSDMMDGRVGAIRQALDATGHADVPIMSYAAKFASSFYGPFRAVVDSAPSFGDRKSYQLDGANAEEAIREAALDLEEGADIIMVKPALAYLDVIYRIKQQFKCPVAAFNVSGEYAMIKAAAARGWVTERPAWLETLTAIRRAGADILITYWAKEAAKILRES